MASQRKVKGLTGVFNYLHTCASDSGECAEGYYTTVLDLLLYQPIQEMLLTLT